MAHAMRKRQPKAVDLGIQTDCTALYIRVSTDTQAEEGFSLEAQRAKLEALCVANGWRVCDAHIYVDAGESGSQLIGQSSERCMMPLPMAPSTRVIVTKLDRLSRNTRDFLEFLDYCDSKRTAIVSIMESFDTGTPTGRAVVTILMAFAELERSQIKERVMTGKVQKARDGGYNGSRAPYGYTYSDGRIPH
jgi:site-specific DNA recombinase